jgi:hypothetical protein
MVSTKGTASKAVQDLRSGDSMVCREAPDDATDGAS